MTMQILMKQTRYGAGGALLDAGSTYTVSDAFGAEMVGAGFATDPAGALQPGRTVPVVGQINPLTGKLETTVGGEVVELGGGSGPKVWRGMGQGMGGVSHSTLGADMSGGVGGWSRTTRTRHYSNASFRRCRVVLGCYHTTGTPLVDVLYAEDYDFQVGFELDYTNAFSGIAPRKMFKFSDAPIANFRIASPPADMLIVSDILDLGRTVAVGEFFGLWTTVEATSKTGDNKCPFVRNGTNYIQRYYGVTQVAGVSQIAANTAETASAITSPSTSQGGGAHYYTPLMLLIETDAGTETVLIDGASNTRGTGEGGNGSGSFGDAIGSEKSDMGFVARGIADLGWNYVTIATGSDSTKERMTPSNWTGRRALAKLANPTKWFCGLGRGDMSGVLAADYVGGHSVGATYAKPAAVLASSSWYILLKAGAGVTTVAPTGTGSAIVCGDYVWGYVGPDIAGTGPRGVPVIMARLMKYIEMVRAEVPGVPITWHVMSTGTTSPSNTVTIPGVETGFWATPEGQTTQAGISEVNSRRSLANSFVVADNRKFLDFAATVSINDLIEDPATQKWVSDGTPYLMTADGAHYNSRTCALAAAKITKASFPV